MKCKWILGDFLPWKISVWQNQTKVVESNYLTQKFPVAALGVKLPVNPNIFHDIEGIACLVRQVSTWRETVTWKMEIEWGIPVNIKIRKRDSSLHDSMPGFKENRSVSLKNKTQEPATFSEENQDFLQNHLQFLFILKQNFLWGPGLILVEKQSIHLKDEPENTKI